MSTPASPPLLVSTPLREKVQAAHNKTGHLIYKCGGIDKRTIEKFEKVGLSFVMPLLIADIFQKIWWGRGSRIT